MPSLSCPLRSNTSSSSESIFRLLILANCFLCVSPTHQQILVRLSVFGTHYDIDDRVYACGQVDEYVSSYVQCVNINSVFESFADGNW